MATYYVSAAGSNSNNGTSTSTPWQTISKVNSSSYAAGDTIAFRCGDTFTGNVTVNRSGAAGTPMIFTSYGAGAKPIINAGGGYFCFGSYNKSYWTVDGLDLRNAFYYAVYFGDTGGAGTGSPHGEVRNCDISASGVGVSMSYSDSCYIHNNYIHDLTMVDTSPSSYYGAIAVNMTVSSSCEISYNQMVRCRASFVADLGDGLGTTTHYDGSGIEFWKTCNSNNIHHNWLDSSDCFMEAGGEIGTGDTFNDNIFAYNIYTNGRGGMTQIHCGASSYAFDTINGNVWDNNVYVPAAGDTSYVIWFANTPSSGYANYRNNIFLCPTGTNLAKYAGFSHSYNIFYGDTIGITLGSHDVNADPLFANQAGADYRLTATSPAVAAGTPRGYTLDYAGNAVSATAPAMGAYEYVSTQGITPSRFKVWTGTAWA